MSAHCSRWLAPLAIATLAACSSNGASRSPDGGSADATGRGGTGAGTGGAAGGGPVHDGGAGGSASETTTTACLETVRAQCEREAACEGVDLGGCLAYGALCPDYYFNADSARTVTGLVNCLPAVKARTCTDLVMGIFPACYVYGRRPSGAGCAYPSQCASGLCGQMNACATCGAGGLTNGSTCTTTSECQTGSYCQGGTCTDASAIVHASEGQPCNLQGTPAVGCVGDLICQETSPPKPLGTCMAPPGAGQPCALAGFSGNVCAAGNTCSTPTGGTCMTTVDAGTSPPPQTGGACTTQNTCQTPLSCKSGACEPPGSTSCPANAPDGGAT